MFNINSTNRNEAKKILTFCGNDSRIVRTMTLAELNTALQRAVNEGLVTKAQVEKHLSAKSEPTQPAADRSGNNPADTNPDTDDEEVRTSTTESGKTSGDATSEENSEGEEGEAKDGETDAADADGDEGDAEDGDADADGDSDAESGDDESESGDNPEEAGDDGDDESESDADDEKESDEEGESGSDDDGASDDDNEAEEEDEDDGSEIEHPVVARVVKYIAAGLNVALVGPAGTGKSYIARQVAAKLDRDFYVNGACMSKYDLIGYCDAGGVYHETPAYKAFTQGGVQCFDELDASSPDAIVSFNGMTDDQPFYTFPNGQQEKHADYTAIACMNTFGNGATADYVGRYKQDAAAMDRFVMVHVDYDAKVETRIAGKQKDILARTRAVRQACNELGIRKVVSYRMIDKACKARLNGVSKKDIDKDIIFAGLDEPAVRQLKTRVNAIIQGAE